MPPHHDIRVLFGKGAWGRSGSKLVSSVSLLPNLGGSDVSGVGWGRSVVGLTAYGLKSRLGLSRTRAGVQARVKSVLSG